MTQKNEPVKKILANFTLEPMVVGYLHYLIDQGIGLTLSDVVTILTTGYVQYYANENDLDMEAVNKASMKMFQVTRKPRSIKSKKEQIAEIEKSYAKFGKQLVKDYEIAAEGVPEKPPRRKSTRTKPTPFNTIKKGDLKGDF